MDKLHHVEIEIQTLNCLELDVFTIESLYLLLRYFSLCEGILFVGRVVVRVHREDIMDDVVDLLL